VASPTLLSSALRYYRLVARWLVQCANPTGAELPLPAEVPKIFSALPEYVITTNRTLPLALALALPLPLPLPLPLTLALTLALALTLTLTLSRYCMDDIAQFFKQLQHIAPDFLETVAIVRVRVRGRGRVRANPNPNPTPNPNPNPNQVAIDELHDFLTLMVTFIGEPRYVKNPYLRATFTKMLRFLVPATEENRTSGHGSER